MGLPVTPEFRYSAGTHMENRTSERMHGRSALAVLLIAIIVCTVAAIVLTLPGTPSGTPAQILGFEYSTEAVERLILSWGAWGVIGSIGLMIIHSFVPFPAEILAIANGMIYGPVWGSLVTWIGAMLGAYLAFGLARCLGRPLVLHLVTRRKLQSIDVWTETRGGITLLVSRLIPMIAFNLINYAAGLTRISWWTFTWATGLGILPITILMAVLGHNMATIPWWLWPFLAGAAIAAWSVLRAIRRRDKAAIRNQVRSASNVDGG